MFLLLFTFAETQAECRASTAPLFSNANPHVPLNISIMTDYMRMNVRKLDTVAVLGVRYSWGTDFMPVILRARGGIRKTACTDIPYKIIFLRSEIESRIEVQVAKENHRAGSVGYMKRYYQLLRAQAVKEERDSSSPENNIFAGLGDDIRVVSHCGNTDTTKIYANQGWLMQNRRVLGEYYIYKILSEFHALTEQVRLAQIQFFHPDGRFVHTARNGAGAVTHSNFAILREPKKRLAQRCGLSSKVPPQYLKRKEFPSDPMSYYRFLFLNAFIGNADFILTPPKNVEYYYSADGKVHFEPYDFDLAYPVTDADYHWWTAKVFDQFVGNKELQTYYSKQSAALYSQAKTLRPRINSLIANSMMAKRDKDKFRAWFDEVYRKMPASR